MAKLFVAFSSLALCVAVAQAVVTIGGYADSECAQKVSFYSTTDACIDKKRSTTGTFSCEQYYDMGTSSYVEGAYYKYEECEFTESEPAVPVPEGWLSFKFTNLDNCNFTSYTVNAVPAAGDNIRLYNQIDGIQTLMNATVTCNNGVLSISSCFMVEAGGCFIFDNAANNVCTNVTTTSEDIFLNGIQTSCIAPPTAPVAEPVSATPVAEPIAPIAAPVAVPVAAPFKAPSAAPVKKSAATSTAGSALAILGAAALYF